jgi:hypothetical protein
MRLKQYFISALLFLCTTTVFSQVLDLYVVNIKGKVTNAENGEAMPYVHIINPRVHGGTTTNIDGMFAIQMLTEDTLIIRSVGFVDQQFVVHEFPPKKSYDVIMRPVRYLIKEVTVTEYSDLRKQLGLPEAKPLDIPLQLRGDAFNEKPKWYNAFSSPLSYIQYHVSESEKRKRETRKIIRNNEEWLQFSTYFNLETIIKITGLKDKEADDFMLYCNINNQLPYFASQMEIEFQIMDLFFKYKKANKAHASKKDSIRE